MLQLLSNTAKLLECSGMSEVVEDASSKVAQNLVLSAVSVFDSKLWHPATSVLAQVSCSCLHAMYGVAYVPTAPVFIFQIIRGCGVGSSVTLDHQKEHASSSTRRTQSSLPPIRSIPPSTAPSLEPLPLCQSILREALEPGAEHFKGFCDRLFNTVTIHERR
jgi:hypothetical protein